MSIGLINIEFFRNIQLMFKPINVIPKKVINSFSQLKYELNENISGIIFDVDQTIVEYGSEDIDVGIKDEIFKLKSKYNCCLLSNYPSTNEKIKRLSHISDCLKIPIVMSPKKKPSPDAFRSAVNLLNLNVNQVVMVGDRIFTDIIGANSFGIFTIYMKPINIWKDPFFLVTIPRAIEYIYYRIIKLLSK